MRSMIRKSGNRFSLANKRGAFARRSCSNKDALVMPEQSYQKNDRQRYAEQPEQCASSEIHGSSPSFVKTDDAGRREEFPGRDEFAAAKCWKFCRSSGNKDVGL
jgi:hypothetical protein